MFLLLLLLVSYFEPAAAVSSSFLSGVAMNSMPSLRNSRTLSRSFSYFTSEDSFSEGHQKRFRRIVNLKSVLYFVLR